MLKSMGPENPSRSSFPNAPLAPAVQTMTPFATPGTAVGYETQTFRPTSGPPQTTVPYSGKVAGSVTPNFRPTPPVRFNGPSVPPPPTNVPPSVGPFQHHPTAQFPSTTQSTPTRPPPMAMGQPFQSPAGQRPAPPSSLSSLQQRPSFPVGPPLQSNIRTSSSSTMPNSFQEPPAARPNYQPPFPGYARNPESQAPPMQSPLLANQGNYVPQSGGYAPPAPVTAPFGLQRVQMQQPGIGPPVATVQGLMEDFSSLTIASHPGSMDVGVDPKDLPRPLEGDVVPKTSTDMFPMNCNPRYLRLTTGAVPSSQSLAARWHLPLGAVVCPLADAPDGEEVPVVNFSPAGVMRCRRCQTYINPYVTFTEGGRKFRCNVCTLLNDVPSEYFAQLDATGKRIDMDQRPELTKGTVEFVAPAEYMIRPPMPPVYFFLIDVSMNAARSGMIEVVAETIRTCLDELPGFPRTQIGFATFDSTIHFYNMKSSLTQPQMMVVSDLEDIFVPLPDDLLVNLSESRSVVESLLASLPSMFRDNTNVESAFGPALKAAFMVMGQLGGKLLIFQNTLPSLGICSLKLRGDDIRVYGTDKEHSLRLPDDPTYKQTAADFSKYQISVNVYAFSDKYMDIASLGTLAKYTGGQVYYYPSFQSVIHGEKLRHELRRDLTRETAWEAVMRIRCAKGVRFTTYHGNFMLRSTDLLALPAVDCDKAFAMQLSLEETLLTTQKMYFQVALLYTASCGERRIRVHTAAMPVVTDLGEMYRLADVGAIVCLLSRLAIEKTLTNKLEDARSDLQFRIVKSLREYRTLYAVQHRLGGKMIYPDSLKFLPLYGLALCKSTPLRRGYADVSLDERCAAGYTIMALPIKSLLKLLYPSLMRLDGYLLKQSPRFDDLQIVEKRLPLTVESLDSRGLFIYDDGFRFILWVGRVFPPDIAMNLLGSGFAGDLSKYKICKHDNEISRKLLGSLEMLRQSDLSYYQLCHLVRQGEQPREGFLVLSNLVEDQTGGYNSYADWVVQISRQIQQNA